MKSTFYKSIFAVALLLANALTQAHSAVVSTQYSNLGNNQWTVDLALTNDSDAAGIKQFTAYFAPSAYAALSVLASPAAWDSFVAQSDPALAAPGFFDSFNAQALALGSTQGGFTIGFTFLGQGAPGQLAFDIVGPDFVATASGTTSAVALPEPSAAFLLLTVCMMFGVSRVVRKGDKA